MADIAKYFNGSTPDTNITFRTPGGIKLLELSGWSQDVPNHKDGTAGLEQDRRPPTPSTLWRNLRSPGDEHYYGWGKSEAFWTIATSVRCWQITRLAAPSFCVPLLITNKGYGLLWTTFQDHHRAGFQRADPLGLRGGNRVSFFVIAGATRTRFTPATAAHGPTHMLPKRLTVTSNANSAMQPTGLLSVAKGYRDRICRPTCW